MDNEESQSLSLKILVAVEKNEVVFAESDHDFVDVLFSWMTIPVGAIVHLIGDQSFGCMSNLYHSVENLDERFLRSKICKEVLLHPRSAAEIYCRNLKVNLSETDDNKYYICTGCRLVTYYSQNGRCRCGRPLKYEFELSSPDFDLQRGFTKSTTHFMISNDLQVRPISTKAGIALLELLGKGDTGMLEERTISVGKDEILELLRFSLVSKTPLTEALLDLLPLNKRRRTLHNLNNGPGNVDQYEETISSSTKADNTISLKLIINSTNSTVLYAEAANDFVDLLCSFLTFPIGYLFQKNMNLPFKGCMHNLYKSINDTKVELFQSADMKEVLLESKLAPGLAQHKKVVSITDTTKPIDLDLLGCYEATQFTSFNESPFEATIADGFIEGPSSFMIMDNLEVLLLSSISGLCLIKKMQIPFGNIVEKEVFVGEKEAMRLFAASLVGENALTDTFLRDGIKQKQ